MNQHVAKTLFAMLDAYWKTLEKAGQFADDPNSYEAFSASHCFRVSHWELFRALHDFMPTFRINIDGLRVEADQEGGIAFRLWSTRPFNAEAQLCSAN